jgi:hypothetical protein
MAPRSVHHSVPLPTATALFAEQGDVRLYSRYKPLQESRFYIQCETTKLEPDGTTSKCGFVQREDVFKRNLNQKKLHTCVFQMPGHRSLNQRRLDGMDLELRTPVKFPEIVRKVAIFVSRSNIAVRSACDSSLRDLLVAAFDEGWKACLTAGRATPTELSQRALPRLTPSLLRRAVWAVASETRSAVISIFREFPFVGLSIDGVTVNSRHFLNIDVVHPFARIPPFTFDFLSENTFTTQVFTEQFVCILRAISESHLTVGGVVSDGCTFQKKALNWRDHESLQAQHPAYERIIFIPCICHLVQTSLRFLYAHNHQYRERIDELRSIAVILRKPRYRARVGATCPAHCPTRWIYDWEIMRFIEGRIDLIDQFFSNDDIIFNKDCLLFSKLL